MSFGDASPSNASERERIDGSEGSDEASDESCA
jgi:hypothetical protein